MKTIIYKKQKNDIESVKEYIAIGGNINIQDEYGNTALILASHYGHTEVAKLLIEVGAKLDIQNKDGYTALICASKNGYTEIVKLLKNKHK